MGNSQSNRYENNSFQEINNRNKKVQIIWKPIDQGFFQIFRDDKPDLVFNNQQNCGPSQKLSSFNGVFNQKYSKNSPQKPGIYYNLYYGEIKYKQKSQIQNSNRNFIIAKKNELVLVRSKQSSNIKNRTQQQSINQNQYNQRNPSILMGQNTNQFTQVSNLIENQVINNQNINMITQKQYQIYQYRINLFYQHIQRQLNSSHTHQNTIKPLPIVNIYQIQHQKYCINFLSDYSLCKKQKQNSIIHIYQEYIPYRISNLRNLTHFQGLYVLEECMVGFQYLYYKFGYFVIDEQMIGFNFRGEVRVWISEFFQRNLYNTKAKNMTNNSLNNQSHMNPQNYQYQNLSTSRFTQQHNQHHKKYSISHQSQYDQKQMVNKLWLIIQKYSLFDQSLIAFTRGFYNCTFQQSINLINRYKNQLIHSTNNRNCLPKFVNYIKFNNFSQSKQNFTKYDQIRNDFIQSMKQKLVENDLEMLFYNENCQRYISKELNMISDRKRSNSGKKISKQKKKRIGFKEDGNDRQYNVAIQKQNQYENDSRYNQAKNVKQSYCGNKVKINSQQKKQEEQSQPLRKGIRLKSRYQQNRQNIITQQQGQQNSPIKIIKRIFFSNIDQEKR